MADWTGNNASLFSAIGARNYAGEEREGNDYYATEPKALDLLLAREGFSQNVWECACGGGHLSEVLKQHGYNVRSTDLFDRGYGESGVDFLQINEPWDGDIITNPPYKYGLDFIRKALEIMTDGHKAAMFFKLQFLEGKARRAFFEKSPPHRIYVSSGRLHCAKNGDFEKYMKCNAATYAWFIWEKGYIGDPIIKWFN